MKKQLVFKRVFSILIAVTLVTLVYTKVSDEQIINNGISLEYKDSILKDVDEVSTDLFDDNQDVRAMQLSTVTPTPPAWEGKNLPVNPTPFFDVNTVQANSASIFNHDLTTKVIYGEGKSSFVYGDPINLEFIFHDKNQDLTVDLSDTPFEKVQIDIFSGVPLGSETTDESTYFGYIHPLGTEEIGGSGDSYANGEELFSSFKEAFSAKKINNQLINTIGQGNENNQQATSDEEREGGFSSDYRYYDGVEDGTFVETIDQVTLRYSIEYGTDNYERIVVPNGSNQVTLLFLYTPFFVALQGSAYEKTINITKKPITFSVADFNNGLELNVQKDITITFNNLLSKNNLGGKIVVTKPDDASFSEEISLADVNSEDNTVTFAYTPTSLDTHDLKFEYVNEPVNEDGVATLSVVDTPNKIYSVNYEGAADGVDEVTLGTGAISKTRVAKPTITVSTDYVFNGGDLGMGIDFSDTSDYTVVLKNENGNTLTVVNGVIPAGTKTIELTLKDPTTKIWNDGINNDPAEEIVYTLTNAVGKYTPTINLVLGALSPSDPVDNPDDPDNSGQTVAITTTIGKAGTNVVTPGTLTILDGEEVLTTVRFPIVGNSTGDSFTFSYGLLPHGKIPITAKFEPSDIVNYDAVADVTANIRAAFTNVDKPVPTALRIPHTGTAIELLTLQTGYRVKAGTDSVSQTDIGNYETTIELAENYAWTDRTIADITFNWSIEDKGAAVSVGNYNLTNIITAPIAGSPINNSFNSTEFNATVVWKDSSGNIVTGNFAANTVYTAEVTLETNTGYHFGASSSGNQFTHTGATSVASTIAAADSFYASATITFNATGSVPTPPPVSPGGGGGGGGGGARPKTHTLTFVSNGGSHVPSVSFRSATNYIITQTSEREGYTFEGWYSNSDFAGSPLTSVRITANRVVYAKWEDKNKPVEPIKPTEPVDPVEPTNPTNPDVTEPVEPVTPVEPEPIERPEFGNSMMTVFLSTAIGASLIGGMLFILWKRRKDKEEEEMVEEVGIIDSSKNEE